MSAKKQYEGIGADEFGRFDKVIRGLLAVPYEELQRKLKEEKRHKGKKKRVRQQPASRASGDDK